MTASELVDWFIALHPGAYVMKGRDAALIRRFISDCGVLPTQMLECMVYGETLQSVPGLLACVNDWLLDDVLAQEAELAVFLSGDDPPACYYVYRDLNDTGIESVQHDHLWNQAKLELEKYVDDALNRVARVHDRSRAASRYRLQHGAVAFGQ